MLRVENLHKTFGGQRLFAGVDWFLGDRDRVGLVGRNGTGKSTLLRMLCGQDFPDSGRIAGTSGQTIGYLPQFGFRAGPGTVIEEARAVFSATLDLRRESEAIEARLAADHVPAEEAHSLLRRHAELDDGFRRHDGYEIEPKVRQILRGLGFRESDFDRPVRDLSGGWQMRLALARLLLLRPDVLLLDEPTNHLDIEARVWLESFLADYPGGYILVSHDRMFLDRTVSRVTEIQNGRLIDYDGNYTRYLELREARYEAARKAHERQQEEIARIERFIERFRAKNTKASQVQSRIKMLEKMERLPAPTPPFRSIRFRFPQPDPSGRMVVRLRGVAKSYGENLVFRGIDLDLERGERVALVGPNGAGKSTLMRILAGAEPLSAGDREPGLRVGVQFFAQDQADRLPPGRTLLEEATDRAPVAFVPNVRGLLGAFLFRGDDVEKQIGVLSGGERNRFALMLMLLRPANLILLDEPTNHLDLEAQEVLLASLRDFEGTIAFVSHDHYFIQGLATRVIEVGGGTIRSHPGDYESFLWKRRREEEEQARAMAEAGAAGADAAATARAEDGAGAADPSASGGGDGARGRGREDRRRNRRLQDLEKQIGKLEERRGRLETLLASDGFYKEPERSRFYLDEHRNVVDELSGLYEEWEALQAQAEGGV